MKAKDLVNLTPDELKNNLQELEEELFNLRFQRAAGRLENPMRFRQVKRNIARVKTEITARKIAAAKAGGAS